MCCIVTSMSVGIVIRRVKPIENDSVHALVQAIADETFAYLFAPSQVRSGGQLALRLAGTLGEEILGVTMTQGEWVSDLWVRRDSRRLASVVSYWHMPNVKYAAVDMTHFAFEWSSRILGPSSFIKITAGEFSVNFRMKVRPHEFEMTKSSETLPVS